MRLPWPDGPFVVAEGTPGAITIVGRLYDGAGNIIPDGLIETWQAGPDGGFAHPDDPRGATPGGYYGFRGFGRGPTAPDGSHRIITLKPRPLPAPAGPCRPPTAASRRRTWTCPSSPAACSTGSSPGCISPTSRPPTRRTRCCAPLPSGPGGAR